MAQRERGGKERKRERRVIEFLILPIIVSGFYRHMHTYAYSLADRYTLNNVSVHTCTQVINISILLTEKEIKREQCVLPAHIRPFPAPQLLFYCSY